MGEDGGETKQYTLDALHTYRGLLLGMLYVGKYHSNYINYFLAS